MYLKPKNMTVPEIREEQADRDFLALEEIRFSIKSQEKKPHISQCLTENYRVRLCLKTDSVIHI